MTRHVVSAAQLPDDWLAYPHPASTQALGDAWGKTG